MGFEPTTFCMASLPPRALTAGLYVDQGDDAIALLDHFLHILSVLVPGVEPRIPIPQCGLHAACGCAVLLNRVPLDLRVEGLGNASSSPSKAEMNLRTAAFRTSTFSCDIAYSPSPAALRA
jgi:hypothetical protein